ncbi:hypothetical protein MGG_15674 [Pyricularia oryzae 70-15]|nr:uncharacterized protein MGG_15674 [Pyricularia oryzae 70-15]EHA54465.1 hypothetical protein MGG_15674 [Pyricularia oryzae 70-15]
MFPASQPVNPVPWLQSDSCRPVSAKSQPGGRTPTDMVLSKTMDVGTWYYPERPSELMPQAPKPSNSPWICHQVIQPILS